MRYVDDVNISTKRVDEIAFCEHVGGKSAGGRDGQGDKGGIGGDRRARTSGRRRMKALLYRLSYITGMPRKGGIA